VATSDKHLSFDVPRALQQKDAATLSYMQSKVTQRLSC
jgi:hypothetical protein